MISSRLSLRSWGPIGSEAKLPVNWRELIISDLASGSP
jgi:hypothetical protein